MKRLIVSSLILALCIAASLTFLLVPSGAANHDDSVFIGSPHQGDILQYSFTSTEHPYNGNLSIHWLPQESVLMPDGTEILANVMEWVFKPGENEIRQKTFHVEGGAIVGSSMERIHNVTFALGYEDIKVPLLDFSISDHETVTHTPNVPCLLSPSTTLSKSTTLEPECNGFKAATLTSTDGFVFRNETIGQKVMMRFQADTPYPVEISWEAIKNGTFGPNDHAFTLEMTGFTRGNVPLEPTPISQVVDLAFDAPTSWMLTDTEGFHMDLQGPYESLVLLDPAIDGTDQIVAFSKVYQNQFGVAREFWNLAFASGEERVVEANAPAALDEAAPKGYIHRSDEAFLYVNPVPDAVLEPSSLVALWEHATGAPADFRSGFAESTCKGPNCHDAQFRIHANQGYTSTASEPVGTGFTGITWQPDHMSITFYKTTAEPTPIGSANKLDPAAPGSVEKPANTAAAAGVAGAGVLASLTYLLKPFWGGLFSREMKDPLEHPARASIMQAIDASPGTHFQGIRKTTGLAAGTTQHHLRMLEIQKCVVREEVLGKTCFFPKGRMSTKERMKLIAHQDKRLHAILAFVNGEERSMTDVAGALGLTASTANHHTTRLLDLGLLTRTKRGRTTFIALA